MNIEKHVDPETLAVLSLDALEPREAGAVRKHVDQCPRCEAIVRSYRAMAAGLVHTIPAVDPPARLRESIKREVSGKRHRDLARMPSWFQQTRLAPVALGLSLVLVIVNIVLLIQVRSIRRTEQQLFAQLADDRVAQGLNAYPETRRVMIEGDEVYGSAVYEDYLQIVVLYVWGLDPLPPDQAYQAWLIDADGERFDGGIFTVDEGEQFVQVIVRAPEMIKSFDALGVTVEPEGGSGGPTGLKVLGVDL